MTNTDLGDAIRRKRTAAGLTQTELAKLAGTQRGVLARWEAGEGIATAALILSCFEFCGTVVTLKGPPQPENIALSPKPSADKV